MINGPWLAQGIRDTPPFGRFFRNWVQSVRRYGPSALAAYPIDLIRIRRSERAEDFDVLFDTDTALRVYPWELPSIVNQRTPEIRAYEAIPAGLLREVLSSIPLRSYEFVFIDMGSGKGRALLVASEFPFLRIEGVELSRELRLIAAENIKRYRSASQMCTAFSLHCMNAIDYKFGPEPLVLFLFNPFGKETLRSMLAQLEASLRTTPRAAFVVYVCPQFESLLRKAPLFRRLKKGGVWWRPWARYVIYATSPSPIGATNWR